MANANEKKLLAKLQHFNDHAGGKIIFELTHDEAEALLKLAKVGVGAKAALWLGSMLRTAFYYAGSIYIAYLAFGEWVLRWLRKA